MVIYTLIGCHNTHRWAAGVQEEVKVTEGIHFASSSHLPLCISWNPLNSCGSHPARSFWLRIFHPLCSRRSLFLGPSCASDTCPTAPASPTFPLSLFEMADATARTSTPPLPPASDPTLLFTPDAPTRPPLCDTLSSLSSTSPLFPEDFTDESVLHSSPDHHIFPLADDFFNAPRLSGECFMPFAPIQDPFEMNNMDFMLQNSGAADAERRGGDTGSSIDTDEEQDELESSKPPTPAHSILSRATSPPPVRMPIDSLMSLAGYESDSSAAASPIKHSRASPAAPSPVGGGHLPFDQVGGGLREATPPRELTSSRLRSKISPMANADSVTRKSAEQRSKGNLPPISFEEYVAKISKPLALPESDKVRARNDVEGRLLESWLRLSSGSAAASSSNASSAAWRSKPEPKPKRAPAPTSPTPPTPPTRLMAPPPLPLREPNLFQMGPGEPESSSARSAHQPYAPKPPVAPTSPPYVPEPTNEFQTGPVEPAPIPSPTPYACFTGEGQTPHTKEGPGPDLLGKWGFQKVPLPPPPPDFVPPASLTTIDTEKDVSGDETGRKSPASPAYHASDASDASDTPPTFDKFDSFATPDDLREATPFSADSLHENNEDDDEVDSGGRPTQAIRDQLEVAFGVMKEAASKAATLTGLTEGRVMQAFMRRVSGAAVRSKTNGWNQYQVYANRESNRLGEWRRFNSDYKCDNEQEVPPQLPQDVLQHNWKVLKETLSLDELRTLFEADHVLHVLHVRGPLGALRRDWKRSSLQLGVQYATNRFQGLLIMVGSHINEDGNLGRILATGGLAKPEFLKKLKVSEDELIGLAKSCAFAHELDAEVFSPLRAPTPLPSVDNSCPNPPPPPIITKVASEASEAPEALEGAEPKPSKKEQPSARNQKAAREMQVIKELLSAASLADVGEDIFHLKSKNNWAWWGLPDDLSTHGFILLGWPADVRLPYETTSSKASAALRAGERASLTNAINARQVSGQGVRVRKERVQKGQYIIFSHDYFLEPPSGPPDSDAGDIWLAPYDFITPGKVSHRRTVIPALGGPKAKGKGRQEDSEDESVSEDVEEEKTSSPPARRSQPAAVKKPEARRKGAKAMSAPTTATPAATIKFGPPKRASKASSKVLKAPPAPPAPPPAPTRTTRSQAQASSSRQTSAAPAPLKSALRRLQPQLDDDNNNKSQIVPRKRKQVTVVVDNSDADDSDEYADAESPRPIKRRAGAGYKGGRPRDSDGDEPAGAPTAKRMHSTPAVRSMPAGPSQQGSSSRASTSAPPPPVVLPTAPPAAPLPPEMTPEVLTGVRMALHGMGITRELLVQLNSLRDILPPPPPPPAARHTRASEVREETRASEVWEEGREEGREAGGGTPQRRTGLAEKGTWKYCHNLLPSDAYPGLLGGFYSYTVTPPNRPPRDCVAAPLGGSGPLGTNRHT
ncbi:hypothetical protein FB451DRAFT_1360600 [Mycena latifolia]|nr:hypothetical protein FB451DRAFT_1360600 [Mycena latifolia]